MNVKKTLIHNFITLTQLGTLISLEIYQVSKNPKMKYFDEFFPNECFLRFGKFE
jgi:hypothetical protein